MAQKYFCDLCEDQIEYSHQKIELQVLDGEHPHNGSEMTTNIDVCFNCAERLGRLMIREELSDLRRKVKRKRT